MMSVFDFLDSFFGNSDGNGRPPEFGGEDKFYFNKPNRTPRNPDFENDDLKPPEFGGEDKFYFNKPNRPPRNPDFENDALKSFSSIFDFKTVGDPFEMNQFFEQKINEIMKSFMSPEGFSSFPGFGSFDSSEVPAISDRSDPRDHYLKPGAKTPSSEKSREEKSLFLIPWLDRFSPSIGQDGNRTFSSFKSIIRKTVTLPDGTVKTEEFIRNSDAEGSTERESDEIKLPPQDSPFSGQDFSGLFEMPMVPEYKDPRYQLLKPGYEKYNPYSAKIDKDLDKQIEQAGIENLPSLTKEPEISHTNRTFKSLTRRIVTLPNGVIECEEMVHNVDGSEQRTVTHTWPDGTSKSVSVPASGSLAGKNDDHLTEGYDKSVISFALRGVKDFIDILMK